MGLLDKVSNPLLHNRDLEGPLQSLKNIVGKGESDGNQHSLLFNRILSMMICGTKNHVLI